MATFMDVYALQSVPPSNINRDDTGSPKTAMYGGSLRARVSSQAWKRAMRAAFSDLLPREELGVRTKLAAALIAERIAAKRPDLAEAAEELAAAVLETTGVKLESSKRKGETEGALATKYLVFIGAHELDGLADCAIGWRDAGRDHKKADKAMKGEVAAVFHGSQAIDIALFGRMLADAPQFNTDASCQVAHAISVNRVTQEYDYFTAVDDCVSDDNAGAGMLGTVEFNSSTLYRYATVDLDALYGQLGDAKAVAAAARAFTEAFARSMPTGKQNTFANRTLPSTLAVAFRVQQPVNLVAAFEDAVSPCEGRSLSIEAERRLAHQHAVVGERYGMPAECLYVLSTTGEDAFGDTAEMMTLPDILKAVEVRAEAACIAKGA